ncbi:ABC transporter permease subunit [Enterococcus asini]|uniref:ABC transporter permease n=1 Tax=Enterococcus asini TaxID=57732 RepID=UPI002892616F|nr:ABC transporter permease subunit [Enterococcus asini]MDT2756505.1 ABC transporter permease subunit [Enterococcus asini]
MLQLIKNEWIKLAKKLSTWIMLAILVGLTIGITVIIKVANPEAMKANDLFATLTDMTSFLNLFVVVVAASSIAEEFSRGTIKFLLIRPYSRTQIFAAKFMNSLLFAILGTVVLGITSFVSANLILKSQSPLAVMTSYGTWSALQVALVTAFVNLILVILYLTITMFISATMRSQAMAVGLGVGVLFGSSLVNSFLAIGIAKYPWLKWNLFNTLNIRETIPQLAGIKLDSYFTLDFWQSLGALGIYSVLFYFFANWIFSARDVALS